MPLFKKGSKSDPKNHRPISLLPAVVSKVIEKTIQTQTHEYSDKNGFSTDSCLVQLGMILADLQKAFDTLDRTVLLQKMKCIGFKESLIKWFQSYLSNRKNFCDNRKCLFRCWTSKLWCSTRIYLRAAPLPNIYELFTVGIKRNWVTLTMDAHHGTLS